MDTLREFQLSIGVPTDTHPKDPQTYSSLSSLLRDDGTVKVLGSATQIAAAKTDETRGLEWVGLLIGVVSSGAATQLVQAIAACFRGPRVSNCTIKIRDEKRNKTVEVTLASLSKDQMDAAIAKIKSFFEDADVQAA